MYTSSTKTRHNRFENKCKRLWNLFFPKTFPKGISDIMGQVQMTDEQKLDFKYKSHLFAETKREI